MKMSLYLIQMESDHTRNHAKGVKTYVNDISDKYIEI